MNDILLCLVLMHSLHVEKSHVDITSCQHILHAGFTFFQTGTGFFSGSNKLGISTELTSRLGDTWHAAALMRELRALGFHEQNGVNTGVNLPFKGKLFKVIQTLTLAVVGLAKIIVTHEANSMSKVSNRSLNSNIDERAQDLEGNHREIIEGNSIGLEDTTFSSMNLASDGITLMGRNGEFFSGKGEVSFQQFLAIDEHLVSIHLKGDISNTQGSTVNLAPPFMDDSTDVEIKGLAIVNHVSMGKDQVTFSMELKGLAVPTLDVRL